MLQEELERDEKVGNRIWRGIGFEIFLLPSRVHARPAEVNANGWVALSKHNEIYYR